MSRSAVRRMPTEVAPQGPREVSSAPAHVGPEPNWPTTLRTISREESGSSARPLVNCPAMWKGSEGRTPRTGRAMRGRAQLARRAANRTGSSRCVPAGALHEISLAVGTAEVEGWCGKAPRTALRPPPPRLLRSWRCRGTRCSSEAGRCLHPAPGELARPLVALLDSRPVDAEAKPLYPLTAPAWVLKRPSRAWGPRRGFFGRLRRAITPTPSAALAHGMSARMPWQAS